MKKVKEQMLEVLLNLKNHYDVIGLKAEYEAEGARDNEIVLLAELAWKAGLKLAIKIGGCEAISDLERCKIYSADYVIAPMIESPYALNKYADSIRKVYDNQHDTQFLYNLETQQGYEHAQAILDQAKHSGVIDGVVFGRVDFVQSLNKTRNACNSPEIFEYVESVAELAKERGMQIVVGGAVSGESKDFLNDVHNIQLDRFETRKVIFSSNVLSGNKLDRALTEAIKFEVLWLKNKYATYKKMAAEDLDRINMLEARMAQVNTTEETTI